MYESPPQTQSSCETAADIPTAMRLLLTTAPLIFLLFVILLCVIFTISELSASNDVIINSSNNLPLQQHTQRTEKLSPICKIADTIGVDSLSITSYGVTMDWSSTEHVTRRLCTESLKKVAARARQNNSNEAASLILTFKVARSGSTFFTNVITNAIKTTERKSRLHWEPFCAAKCYHAMTTEEEEAELGFLVTGDCRGNEEVCKSIRKCCSVPSCKVRERFPSLVSLKRRRKEEIRCCSSAAPPKLRSSAAHELPARRSSLLRSSFSLESIAMFEGTTPNIPIC